MSSLEKDNELPNSPAADRNKAAILDKLKGLLKGNERVFEIGSGTGQHAIHFAQAFPNLNWQTSELPSRLFVTSAVLNTKKLQNLQKPYALDVSSEEWPEINADVIYTANTVHIMPWHAVEKMLHGVSKTLKKNGLFIIYGPFKYEGAFTSESNKMFDASLKDFDPLQGIRDFEYLARLSSELGLVLKHDFEMPANNRLVVFEKT